MLLSLLLLCCAPFLVRGNSSGADPACFDGSETLCNHRCPNDKPRSWTTAQTDGSLFPCCPAGMDLVAPPTRSAMYSISASVSEYTPCGVFTISIDVRNTDYKYLGLLLYAIADGDTTETQVGQWVLQPTTTRFWTPPGCQGAALMHSMATIKFFHEEFRFQAPASGTGTLRFRAVVKHGETNGGAFYWPSASATSDGPVTADDLIIQETSTTSLPLTRWLWAKKGESCEDKCGAAEDSMTCDGTDMVDALKHSGADMMEIKDTKDTMVDAAFSCNLPLLSKNGFPCTTRDELHASKYGDCFYRTDAVCPASTPEDLCSRTNAGRLCACKLTSEGDTRGALSGKCPPLEKSFTSKTAGGEDASDEPITITGDLLLSETKNSAEVNVRIKAFGEGQHKGFVYINIEGPGDRWFAVAFGTKTMASEPYAIIVDKNGWQERRLGNHKAGTKLSGKSIVYYTQDNFGVVQLQQTRTLDFNNRQGWILKRPFRGENDDYYSFSTSLKQINVIVASGATAGDDEFGKYHGPVRRSAHTITFDRPDPKPTKAPTKRPTQAPNTYTKPSGPPTPTPPPSTRRPNAKPSGRPNAKPSDRPNAKPSEPSGPGPRPTSSPDNEFPDQQDPAGPGEDRRIGKELCERDPAHWSCNEQLIDLAYSTTSNSSGTHQNNAASSAVAALIATCVYSLAPSSSKNIAVVVMVLLLADRARAHNWANNPPARSPGLPKIFPCPPRKTPTNIDFIAQKNTPFALEWSIGHPGGHVYFAIVKREDEAQMVKHTRHLLYTYITEAPKGSTNLLEGGWTHGKKYDRTHYHTHGDTFWAFEPLPIPGQDRINVFGRAEDFSFLKGFLSYGDEGYWERPANWRCGKMGLAGCKNRNMVGQQYEYHSYVHRSDVRASYTNPKMPWLVAVMRYRINRRFPQMNDLAQLYFPLDAKSGEYIIQYHWQGYFNCWDVLYDAETTGIPPTNGGTPSPAPQLITKTEWLKVNHGEYSSSGEAKYTPDKDITCIVMKAGTSAQECMTRCEGQKWCNAINVVRLTHPSDVRFSSVPVNIPFDDNECKKETLLKRANDLSLNDEDAMVCYGFDVELVEQPEVGEKYTSTVDPLDPVFYSTCYRFDTTTSVIIAGNAGASPTAAPRPRDPTMDLWRTGGKCLACADVQASAVSPATFVPKWTFVDDCVECRTDRNGNLF